ncbi:uncharacterized protein DUF4422 [Rhizobium sp. PP-CC-2G-626]|nr:uncharacterized protein DUF4422 [Rhizobium sp. PP-CC-2G-626]
MSDIEIYVAAFQTGGFPPDSGYVPIQVGKEASNVDLGIIGDNTGDNISLMNPYYCELTALYWMWKNSAAKIVGLTHYRRFFAHKNEFLGFRGAQIASSFDFNELNSGLDMIVGSPARFYNVEMQRPISNEEQYSSCTIGLDLATTREAIEQLDRSYLSYYDYVMRDNTCSLCNMFVGRKEIADEYAEWLFAIFDILETWIPYKSYGYPEKRVFGFLGERLLNVWVAKNRKKYRIGYRPIIFCP